MEVVGQISTVAQVAGQELGRGRRPGVGAERLVEDLERPLQVRGRLVVPTEPLRGRYPAVTWPLRR